MRPSITGDNRKITIYDIAAEAGVSASTVSRVLTGSARVNETKKERVLAAVEKYSFTPNALAKGLADAKSRMIGLLMADIRNPYYASLFVACEQAARKENYSVSVYNFLRDMELEEQLLGKLREQRVDAIILLGGHADELVTNMAYAEQINNIMEQIPVILIGKLDGTGCDMVRIDHMKSMDLLMGHLLSLGHERIAVLGGKMDVLSTYEKVMRYKQILKSSGLSFDPDLIGQGGGYDIRSGYTQMNELYQKKDLSAMPTAVIAINDYGALGVMQSIREHGGKIPEDISVASFDNTYIAETAMPGLTSVGYDYEAYGSLLVKAAVGRMNGLPVEKLQMVEPVLVVRGSSGLLPK